MQYTVHLDASFGADTDINAFWDKVKTYPNVHLGGTGSRYTVTYEGDGLTTIRIIEAVESVPDHEIHAYYTSPKKAPAE